MCDCIARVNMKLADRNAQVDVNLFAKEPYALVRLCKVEERKRGSIPIMAASYCPFCGEKYSEDRP